MNTHPYEHPTIGRPSPLHALSEAIAAVAALPALVEARERLRSCLGEERPSAPSLIAAIESDVGLAIAVLRRANRPSGRRRPRVESIAEALDALGPADLASIVANVPTFDFLQHGAAKRAHAFRLHALTTQRAADRIAAWKDYDGGRDRLAVTSLLHDIGKLVLADAFPTFAANLYDHGATPEESLAHERRTLGLDHALIGGVLARRWGLPDSIAGAIEHHHDPVPHGDAPIIHLADMLAHVAQGEPVSSRPIVAAARTLDLDVDALRELIYETSDPHFERARALGGCPLSERERDALSQLAEGRTYREIAVSLGLSPSTVRTHLHNVYRKLGVADRAQAVLHAAEYGWLARPPAHEARTVGTISREAEPALAGCAS